MSITLGVKDRTPEMQHPSREIEKDNFRFSKVTQIRTKNDDSLEFKVSKQWEDCVALAVEVS